MSDVFYPAVTVSFLDVAKRLKTMVKTPELFEYPECHYSEDVKAQLLELFTALVEASQNAMNSTESSTMEVDAETARILETLEEVNRLYTELKESNTKIKSEGSTADQMGYFRTSTSLLEKIIDMRERVSSLRHYKDFTNGVMDVLEEVCTPAQRTEIINRLGSMSGRL